MTSYPQDVEALAELEDNMEVVEDCLKHLQHKKILVKRFRPERFAHLRNERRQQKDDEVETLSAAASEVLGVEISTEAELDAFVRRVLWADWRQTSKDSSCAVSTTLRPAYLNEPVALSDSRAVVPYLWYTDATGLQHGRGHSLSIMGISAGYAARWVGPVLSGEKGLDCAARAHIRARGHNLDQEYVALVLAVEVAVALQASSGNPLLSRMRSPSARVTAYARTSGLSHG
ncbi:hypothetical protein V8E36_003863 [Tilletia maclaganii]